MTRIFFFSFLVLCSHLRSRFMVSFLLADKMMGHKIYQMKSKFRSSPERLCKRRCIFSHPRHQWRSHRKTHPFGSRTIPSSREVARRRAAPPSGATPMTLQPVLHCQASSCKASPWKAERLSCEDAVSYSTSIRTERSGSSLFVILH